MWQRVSWINRFGVVSAGLALASCLCSGQLGCAPPSAQAPESEEGPTDWNAGAISWREYDAGLAEARATNRPIVLIFYTDWCPHCHNYSRVFYDEELTELARAFVMIRVERDGHRDISARYDLDGDYVPRTFFLRPDGSVRTELAGENSEYQYFLDEDEPSELIGLMRRALASPA
jgi:thiol:disulfide interchange protein